MNYLILHLFVTVYFCSRKTFGSSSKKANKFDIDDFISSLLSSRKFDELADKIADKAVFKLATVRSSKGEDAIENNNKNIDDDSTEHTTQRSDKRQSKGSGYNERVKKPISNNENDEKQAIEETHKPKLNKIELRIEKGDADYKETVQKSVTKDESREIQEEVVIEEVHDPVQNKQKYIELDNEGYEETAKRPVYNDGNKVKKGKINTEALLKNDDDSDQPQLLLKYEHFKKRVQQNKAHGVPKNAGETNNYFKNFKISINDKSIENKDQIDKHGSSKLDSTEKKTKQKKKIAFRGRKDLADTSGDGEPDIMPQHNVRKPQFRDGKYLKGAYQSAPSFLQRTTKQYYEYEESEKTNLRYGPVIRQNFTDSKSDEAESNTEPGYEQGELTTRKRIIRKEGNKYYTYLSGPEYEEFQAEFQKQENTNENEKVYLN